MDKSWTTEIENTLLAMSRQNPFLKSMDPVQLEEWTREFRQSAENAMQSDGQALSDWTNSWLTYQRDIADFWTKAMLGSGDNIEPSQDPRFQSDDWNKGIFKFLRHSYEITAKAIADMADSADLPEREQRKLSFYARLAADNISPSNFLMTNPEVLQLAQETGGQSLMDGLQNLLDDLGKGYISTTDETAFEVGKNLATTPGSVIFRNELIELIHYEPMAPKVRGKPLVIVPPCVNKFYIFDLNERKSMVRYLLENGQDVFMLVWRNAGDETADYGWDEYLEKGIFEAISIASNVSGSEAVDTVSWCNGGSMLLAGLAVMPDELKQKVATATFLSSMIDFSDPGEVEVFFDKPQMEAFNLRLAAKKVVPGRDIANAMAMLHVNESIWNFVISNYLKGKSPPPFDVLYWNSDTSNLPSTWYSYYIEEMYVANKLKEPNALIILGTPVDTRNIEIPCYFVAASEDHIVPWKTSYDAISLVSGQTEFVLTPGGHVSGTVINHPTRNRRHFLTNGQRDDDAEHWRDSAERTEGSWWPHWVKWLEENNPCETRASQKKPGNNTYKPLYPAPGKYVVEDVN